jgi:hypothetical protein
MAVYVDTAAVNKQYGDQIKAAQGQVDAVLGIAASQVGEANKASIEMAKKMIAGVFQAMEDSRAVLATADFRPEGLAVHVQGKVAAGTPSDAILKGAEPTPLGELRSLPAGQLGYFAMKPGPGLMDALKPLLSGALAGAQDDNKELLQAFDLINQAGPGVVYGSFNIPVAGLTVWTYKDPQKAVQGQVKLMRAMKPGAAYQMAALKEKPEIKENARTYHDFKLTRATVKLDWEKVAEGAPGAQEMAEAMKKLFGGEEMRSWFGTDGKLFVSVTAKNWDGAKKQLDDFFAGGNMAGTNAALQATRKQLPAAATMVGLIDVPRYGAVIAEFMGPMLKAQGLPVEIPALKAEAGKSYVGVAVTLRPQHAGLDLWIPATTVTQVHKMVRQFAQGENQ